VRDRVSLKRLSRSVRLAIGLVQSVTAPLDFVRPSAGALPHRFAVRARLRTSCDNHTYVPDNQNRQKLGARERFAIRAVSCMHLYTCRGAPVVVIPRTRASHRVFTQHKSECAAKRSLADRLCVTYHRPTVSHTSPMRRSCSVRLALDHRSMRYVYVSRA